MGMEFKEKKSRFRLEFKGKQTREVSAHESVAVPHSESCP